MGKLRVNVNGVWEEVKTSGGITISGSVPSAPDLPPPETIPPDTGYITEDDGHLWVVIHEPPPPVWVDLGPVQGPPGVPGVDGVDGAPGVAGPPGPTVVSADANNTAVLGTDSFIFVPPGTGTGAATEEVFVGTADPYATNPAGTWLLWVDVTDPLLPVMKVRLSGAWVTVSGGTGAGPVVEEVVVATADPGTAGHDLWFDPDAVVVTAGEIYVGDVEPVDSAVELWFDPSAPDASVTVMNEVWVSPDAPTDGNIEVWVDPMAPDTQERDEVWVGATQPPDTTELWIEA